MFDIIGKRQFYIIFSSVLVLASIIILIFAHLPKGIDFSPGSQMTVSFNATVTRAELSSVIAKLGYKNTTIQTLSGGDFLISLPELQTAEKTALEQGMIADLGGMNVQDFMDVGPAVAQRTTDDAAVAVVIAAIGILLYIAWAFRKMQHPFRYGTSAIIALIHDSVISMGIFTLIGHFFGWEIDLMFVTGVLAVVGYSVNDTVIAFDRIRENMLKNERYSFQTVVNKSLVETIGRSLNTSLTTIFVVIALILFIGPAIYNFAVVMLAGIVVGTYSSIFIAPALLVIWQTRHWTEVSQSAPKLGEA